MHPKLIAAAATAAVIAGATLAGTMFGTVKDEQGKPVANADVKVYGKDDLKAKSDTSGKFKIESKDLLDGNKYSVTVSADGYDGAQTISVEMFDDPKDMDPIDIVLYKPEPVPASWTNTVNDPFMQGMMSGSVMRTDPNMPPGGGDPEAASTNPPPKATTNATGAAKAPAATPAPATSNTTSATAKPATK